MRMKKFESVILWLYTSNNDLLDWWYDADYHVWKSNDGFYLSDCIYSKKYKVANTFDELIEYLQELKHRESEYE